MKRFFCKVCKKVKRVQKFPVFIENKEATDPSLRIGECNRHHGNVKQANTVFFEKKVKPVMDAAITKMRNTRKVAR